MIEIAAPTRPSPLRRLGALFYDALLLVAVLFVVAALFLPFTGGKSVLSGPLILRVVYRLTLVTATVSYFGIAWTTKGQTLGMKVWGLVIKRIDGSAVSWHDVLTRVAFACVPWLPGLIATAIAVLSLRQTLMPIAVGLFALVPLSYLGAYFDNEGRAWHERWLKTRVIRA